MGHYVFRLPDVGEGTVEAEIVAWHVRAGDRVREDQPLVDVMTDKATVEITSPVEGGVVSIHGVAGDMAAVGATLVTLEVEGAGNAATAPAEPRTTQSSPAVAEAKPPAPDMLGEGDYLFRLPDVGEGTAEVEIVAWHVKPGEDVAEDQLLVEVLTDKANVEITSPVTGRVVSVSGEPGAMAAVGSTLAVFSTGSVAAAPGASEAGTPQSGVVEAPAPPPQPQAAAVGATQLARSHTLAAPAVRRRAAALGVNLSAVHGSGREGIVTHEDLDAQVCQRGSCDHASSSIAYARRSGVQDIPVIGLRRKIAERMQAAKRNIPHFAYVEEVDVTELEALRVHLNSGMSLNGPREEGQARLKLTVAPFLIRALTAALPRHPQINATYDDAAGVVHRHAAVHLGMATQTRAGLIVPVIRHAEARDLWDLAAEISRLSNATRGGTAARDELSGSTITLTSLGPLGGVAHTPVINAPEVAIVGPNKIMERPVVHQGQVVVRKMMNISASFDHRVVDGYDAAEFIQTLKGLLEHPATLFIL